MGRALGSAGGWLCTISKEKLGGKFAASGYRVFRNAAVPHFYSGPLRFNAILFVYVFKEKMFMGYSILFRFS